MCFLKSKKLKQLWCQGQSPYLKLAAELASFGHGTTFEGIKVPRLRKTHGKHLCSDNMASISVQTMCGRFRIHVRKFWVHSVWSYEGKAMETWESWKYRTMGLLLRTAAFMKTSWHGTVVLCATGSRVAEMRPLSPFHLSWFLFKFYGLDMELQDVVFVLLDIGFALANSSLLCVYTLL